MKNILLGTIAIILFFASSCKKKEDDSLGNHWTMGPSVISASSVSYNAPNRLIGYAITEPVSYPIYEIDFIFPNLRRPVAGTYKVVDGTGTPWLNSDELYFSVTTFHSLTSWTAYGPSGKGLVYATVSVNNGKISIDLPSAEVINATDSSDKFYVSAKLTEQ